MRFMISNILKGSVLQAIVPIIGLAWFLTARSALAQSSYSYSGGAYSQTFDSLPFTSGTSVNSNNPVTIGGVTYTLPAAGTPFSLTDTTIGSGGNSIGGAAMAGWWSVGLSSSGNRLGAQGGDQTAGGLISFGSTSGTNQGNRAIGLMATNTTGITEMGVDLVNNTGGSLNELSISYLGQLWRNTSTTKTLNFGYYFPSSGTGDLISAVSGATPDAALQVSFPGLSGSSTLAGLTTPLATSNLSDTFYLPTAWANGATLWLTWQISSSAGSGQGLALDNLSFSGSSVANPPTVTWNTTSGSWDKVSQNWTSGGTNTTYNDGDNVVFGSISSNGTVSIIPGGVLPTSIVISNSANTYTLSGGPIGGGGNIGLNKSGAGAAVLATSNSYTGGTIISGGTLPSAEAGNKAKPSAASGRTSPSAMAPRWESLPRASSQQEPSPSARAGPTST